MPKNTSVKISKIAKTKTMKPTTGKSRGGKTTTIARKTNNLTWREYNLEKKRMRLEYGKGKEAQKTRRIEAISTSATVGAEGVAGAAAGGSAAAEAEKTKREQLKLISPVLVKESEGSNESGAVANESSSDPEGNIPFM